MRPEPLPREERGRGERDDRRDTPRARARARRLRPIGVTNESYDVTNDDLEVVVFFFGPRIGRRRAMATPDPPPGSGTVTVASQGAAAFVGDVYYLADGRTGDPILGWPPRPPPVGFSRGDARDGDDTPDAFGRTKAQREGDRVLLATNAADATRAMRRFRETCFPSRPTSASVGETRVSDDEARAVASLDSAATRNRALGPSAYFPDPAFARRWAEVVNRPCGLSYRAFARRRLRRPSDKPLLPHGVAIRAAPFARAYANLTVGWNNAALAAKRGLAPSASARRDAADALFARSDLDPSAVMGANPEIAGDGTAESVAPLLTGYEGFLPFAPFEDENAFGRTGREGEERGSARDPLANDGGGFPRSINAWLADDLAAVESVDGSHYPETSGSWRAVAARVGGLDAARTDSKTNREKTNRESGKKDAADARGAWYRGFDESFDDGSEHERERFDRVVSARAVDRENVSVGECPRRAGAERPPADTPVFSSPLVHVVAVGGAAGRRDAERGFENVSVTGQVTGDSSRVVISENEGARDKKSASEYPLGVKFATRDEATGNVAVTSAQMYRPWFLKLEDLREMVRATIKTEAEARVARNRARREKTNRALAAMLTAVCHTKPNPRLSGFQMPGLDGANRGAGRGGSGGVAGGVSLGGGGDDDDDSEDDDDDPRNEGLEDDDDGSLNDDELMKEYMREMVKDGTAEDALGAWARDAARAAKEARENAHPKGRKNDEKADDSEIPSVATLDAWFSQTTLRREGHVPAVGHLSGGARGFGFRRHVLLRVERLAFVLRRRAGPRVFKNQLRAVEPGHRHAFGGRHGTRRDRVVRGRVLRRRRPSRRERRVAPLRRDGEGAIGDERAFTSGRRVDDGRLAARRRRRKRPSPRQPSASLICWTSWGTSGTGGRGRRETRRETTRRRRSRSSGVRRDRTRRTSRGRAARMFLRRDGTLAVAPCAACLCCAESPSSARNDTTHGNKKRSRVVPTPPRGARGG